MDWQARHIKYTPTLLFTGTDTIKIVGQDDTGLFSDVITLTVVMMEHPCQNDGVCESKSSVKSLVTELRIVLSTLCYGFVYEYPHWFGQFRYSSYTMYAIVFIDITTPKNQFVNKVSISYSVICFIKK